MAIISESALTETLILLLSVIVTIVTYYKWAFTYWKNRHLPCFEEPSIPFGNWKTLFTERMGGGLFTRITYEKSKTLGLKCAGAYAFFGPYFLPIDPEIIKDVLQRNFDYFSDRGFYTNERDDPLGANLAFVCSEKWRYLRTKLSPAFSPGKMKGMFDIVMQCGFQLKAALDDKYENKQEIDINDVSISYTTDIIGACAYGLDCNSFKNPDSKFKKYGKKGIGSTSIFHIPKIVFGVTFPNAARKLGMRVFDKDVTDFFIGLVKDSVKLRKNNNIVRKDLLQLLLELEADLDVEEIDKETATSTRVIKELAAQVFIFFIAGFETSSTTITLCLTELAINQDVQEKLRKEVGEILTEHGGRISYDAIMDMKYMDQVIEETLRKYPPVPFLARKCEKDYKIPDTEVVIEKGIYAFISTWGLHHDPDYYPEPEKFDPERFSEENKQKRIPFTYLPFGEGPRMCPAYRFGLMQIKVGLTVLLQHYLFTLNNRTSIPIEMNPYSFTMMPKSGVFLNIEKRNVNNNLM